MAQVLTLTIITLAALVGVVAATSPSRDPCSGPGVGATIAHSPPLQRLVARHDIERTVAESAVLVRYAERIIGSRDQRERALIEMEMAQEKVAMVAELARRQNVEFTNRCRALLP